MGSPGSDTPQRVSLYSVNDLKNVTDDALAPYFTSLPEPYKFVQSHAHTNTRLALGYSAVAIGAVTFYADWKLGWEETKVYTAVACVIYFALNSLLTFHIWKVEAGRVFVGTRAGGEKIALLSSIEKNSPLYKLKVLHETPAGKKSENEVTGNFTLWFNEFGYLQRKELKAWLAKNIDVTGKTVKDKELEESSKVTPLEGSLSSGVEGSNTLKGRKLKKKG